MTHIKDRISNSLSHFFTNFKGAISDKSLWKIIGLYLFLPFAIFIPFLSVMLMIKGAISNPLILILDTAIISLLAIPLIAVIPAIIWSWIITKDEPEYKNITIKDYFNISLRKLWKLISFFVVFAMVSSALVLIPFLGEFVLYPLWFFATLIVTPLILMGNGVFSSIKQSWNFVKENILEIITTFLIPILIVLILGLAYSNFSASIPSFNDIRNLMLNDALEYSHISKFISLPFIAMLLQILGTIIMAATYRSIFQVYRSYLVNNNKKLEIKLETKTSKLYYFLILLFAIHFIAPIIAALI